MTTLEMRACVSGRELTEPGLLGLTSDPSGKITVIAA